MISCIEDTSEITIGYDVKFAWHDLDLAINLNIDHPNRIDWIVDWINETNYPTLPLFILDIGM